MRNPEHHVRPSSPTESRETTHRTRRKYFLNLSRLLCHADIRLGVSRDTVRRWLRSGWLNAHRDADGHHVIWADANELRRLRVLHRLPRTWANKGRLAKLKRP